MIKLSNWFKRLKLAQAPRIPVVPTSTLDAPVAPAAPVAPTAPTAPIVVPPSRRPQVSSGFKRGDKVSISTMSRPELLGAIATVLRVFPGGKRIAIQVDSTKEEFLAKPSILLNITNSDAVRPHSNTPVLPPRNIHKIYLKESSDPVVNNALLYHRNVGFNYVDLHGNYTTRSVEPHIVFQARGTLNELLLSKDWVLRGGEWRCFRVEAMNNTSLGERYAFKLNDTYNDVKDSIRHNMLHKAEKYNKPDELLRHMYKDNTLNGLIAYRHKLKRDILHKRLKMHHDL